MTPWQQGKNLAREMRKAYRLGSRPIDDEELAGMLAIPPTPSRGDLSWGRVYLSGWRFGMEKTAD